MVRLEFHLASSIREASEYFNELELTNNGVPYVRSN